MNKLFLILTLAISFATCSNNQKQGHTLYRLHRHALPFNGRPAYTDMLLIANYHNEELTAMDLYKMAKNYLDTVKCDTLVNGVWLVGKLSIDTSKSHHWNDTDIEDIRSETIVSISFANYAKGEDHMKRSQLPYIIFKIRGDGMPSTFRKKNEIDSVLNSPAKISY